MFSDPYGAATILSVWSDPITLWFLGHAKCHTQSSTSQIASIKQLTFVPPKARTIKVHSWASFLPRRRHRKLVRHSELSYLLLVTLAYYQTQVKWSGCCIIGRPGGGATAERRQDRKRASAGMSGRRRGREEWKCLGKNGERRIAEGKRRQARKEDKLGWQQIVWLICLVWNYLANRRDMSGKGMKTLEIPYHIQLSMKEKIWDITVATVA